MTDNRSALITTALRLFADQGYDAVGVQQIVDAVGVTKPTLYHYFGSKHGLLQAILEEQAAPLLHDVHQVSTYRGDVKNAITATVRVFFAFAQNNPTFYRMLLTMWFAPVASEYFPLVSDLLNKLYFDVVELFKKAELDHGNMRGRHTQYAASLRGVIDTYIALSLQGFVTLDEQLITRIVHQFMHGIFS